MPCYKPTVMLFFTLASASLLVGLLSRALSFQIIGLTPLSYMRFSGLCLLFVIAASLVELACQSKSPDGQDESR